MPKDEYLSPEWGQQMLPLSFRPEIPTQSAEPKIVDQLWVKWLHSRNFPFNDIDVLGATFIKRQRAGDFSIVRGKDRSPRTIDMPNRPMKAVHRWLLKGPFAPYLDVLSDSACGIKGRSLADMISPHGGSRYFLKLDLSAAYSHVDIELLAEIMARLEGDDPDAYRSLLDRFCTQPEGTGLPEGANTSPLLFNLYLAPLDEQLEAYAEKQELVYSRYLDDLVFSSADSPLGKRKATHIKHTLAEYGFAVNQHKVRYHDLQEDGPFRAVGIQLNPSGSWQMPTNYARNVIHFFREELRGIERYPDIPMDRETMGAIRGVHGHMKACVSPNRPLNRDEKIMFDLYHKLEDIYRIQHPGQST